MLRGSRPDQLDCKPRPAMRFLSALLALTLLVACGPPATPASDTSNVPKYEAGEPAPRGGSPLKVVTTVSPITSIVENIGGARIKLEGIVPEGVNSHTFAPAPSVAKLMSEADLIVINGLFLEEPTLEMAEANKKPGAVLLSLGDQAVSTEQWQFDFSFPESGGHPNPHLWPDPLLALRYAELVAAQLGESDPANADYYRANLDEFRDRVELLDQGVSEAVATIPEANRRLLTYHDSWAYFALRYDMEVIGAVQPSDFSEPSAREVAQLIVQVRELGLPAVFGSEVFPSDVLETIAREAGARFIDDLADDDLPGVPGDPRHSYLGLMLHNLEIMIPALGGNPDSLKGVDPGPVFEGRSEAIYPQ